MQGYENVIRMHLSVFLLEPGEGDTSADPEGGGAGGPDPPPPGKSQVIWVSIGNKQLDPTPPHPPPLEKVGPPWKMLDPLRNLEK